jgi:hypothetical protein
MPVAFSYVVSLPGKKSDWPRKPSRYRLHIKRLELGVLRNGTGKNFSIRELGSSGLSVVPIISDRVAVNRKSISSRILDYDHESFT